MKQSLYPFSLRVDTPPSLEQILDQEEVELCLYAFSKITNLSSGLMDIKTEQWVPKDKNILTCDVCIIIRGWPEGAEKCRKCDLEHLQSLVDPGTQEERKGEREKSYQCHLGLRDFVVPIKINSTVIGGLFGGQVIGEEDDLEDIEARLNAIATELGIQPHLIDRLIRLLQDRNSTPRMSLEEIEKQADQLENVGRMMSKLAYNKWQVVQQRAKLTESVRGALRQAIELKDDLTKKHLSITAQVTGLLADYIGISDADKYWIGVASELHDVGKIVMSKDILKNQKNWDDLEEPQAKEFAVEIELHPEWGVEILYEGFVGSSVDLSWILCVLCHHCKKDLKTAKRARKNDFNRKSFPEQLSIDGAKKIVQDLGLNPYQDPFQQIVDRGRKEGDFERLHLLTDILRVSDAICGPTSYKPWETVPENVKPVLAKILSQEDEYRPEVIDALRKNQVQVAELFQDN